MTIRTTTKNNIKYYKSANSAEAAHSFHFNGVVLCFVYQNYLCLAKFVHTNTVYSVYSYLVNYRA